LVAAAVELGLLQAIAAQLQATGLPRRQHQHQAPVAPLRCLVAEVFADLLQAAVLLVEQQQVGFGGEVGGQLLPIAHAGVQHQQQPRLALGRAGAAAAARLALPLGQHQLLDAAAQHLAIDGGGLPLGLQPLQLLHHFGEAAAQLRIGPEGFIRLPLAALGLAEAFHLLQGGIDPSEFGRLLRWAKQWVHAGFGLLPLCHGCAALAWILRG